jgi:hypothetical protein
LCVSGRKSSNCASKINHNLLFVDADGRYFFIVQRFSEESIGRGPTRQTQRTAGSINAMNPINATDAIHPMKPRTEQVLAPCIIDYRDAHLGVAR